MKQQKLIVSNRQDSNASLTPEQRAHDIARELEKASPEVKQAAYEALMSLVPKEKKPS